MEEQSEYYTIKHFYTIIDKYLKPASEINSIKHCITVSKIIKYLINNIIFGTGLREWVLDNDSQMPSTHSSPQKIFVITLGCIRQYLLTGDEYFNKQIKLGLDAYSGICQALYDQKFSSIKKINPGDTLLLDPDIEKNEDFYKTYSEVMMYYYNSINKLYINAKLCREKMKQFSQNSL